MSFAEMYDAVISNDESYDTVFFYAVKSTGIYCRPFCKSKAPKLENIEFYTTAEEAIKAGYRPCKRCRSDLPGYKSMKDIAEKLKNLIDDVLRELAEEFQMKENALQKSNDNACRGFTGLYRL